MKKLPIQAFGKVIDEEQEVLLDIGMFELFVLSWARRDLRNPGSDFIPLRTVPFNLSET